MQDKLRDDGALAYLIYTSFIGAGFVIYSLLYFLIREIVAKIAPLPRIGAAILFAIATLNLSIYYINGGKLFFLAIIGDLVVIIGLAYMTFSQDGFD